MIIKRLKLSVSYRKAHIFLICPDALSYVTLTANPPNLSGLPQRMFSCSCNMIVRVRGGSPLHRLHSVTQEDKATPLTPWPRIEEKENKVKSKQLWKASVQEHPCSTCAYFPLAQASPYSTIWRIPHVEGKQSGLTVIDSPQ